MTCGAGAAAIEPKNNRQHRGAEEGLAQGRLIHSSLRFLRGEPANHFVFNLDFPFLCWPVEECTPERL